MANFSKKDLLHFEIHGEGYPVVFLHGFLESNSMWSYFPLQQLSVKRILIDLPGHGQSSNSTGAPSISNMSRRVLLTLKSLGIEQFSIVGHSMGGYVALDLKQKVKNVEKVILLNSNYWADTKEKAADRQRIANFIFEGKNHFLNEAIPNLFLDRNLFREEINALIEEAKKITPESIAYSSIAMSKRKRNYRLITEHLSDFFIIQGDKDPVAPKALWNPKIVDKNPNYFEISNCGHMAHIEKSAEAFQILMSILNKI